jgi:hypothetical protein
VVLPFDVEAGASLQATEDGARMFPAQLSH